MKLLLPAAIAAVLFAVAAAPQDTPRGQQLFERRCSGCHSLTQDKEGPRLGGVYGRVSGTVESFPYSEALRNARITWNSESLEKWLSGPDRFVPGADMTFSLENADERAAIIAWLKETRKSATAVEH